MLTSSGPLKKICLGTQRSFGDHVKQKRCSVILEKDDLVSSPHVHKRFCRLFSLITSPHFSWWKSYLHCLTSQTSFHSATSTHHSMCVGVDQGELVISLYVNNVPFVLPRQI
jgi:hypothetical protein